ncbi:hypothetical protein VTL71DRAFT_13303 [Oculimacula yallundae]|uniref:Uncharacterized protein n=1 Tax=Oculimacula yallundae TaxID=86028 RepID=A0ABR4CL84_9HELO
MSPQKQGAYSPEPDHGTWLCSEGPYLEYMKKFERLHPGIGIPDQLNRHIVSRIGQSRSVLLELTPDHRWNRQTFQNKEDIKIHFVNREQSDNAATAADSKRRVYILEGLDPEFVEAYGSYFFMDPRFFSRQERNDPWNLKIAGSVVHDTDSLPSSIDPERYFRVKYGEVREFDQLDDWRTVCAVTGRHLAAIGFGGKLDTTAAVARRFSYWSRMGKNNSWDVVILCDPPVLAVRVLSRPTISDIFRSEPFQGGYPDFIKRADFNPNIPQFLAAPPRTSFLDDLCFYYECHYQSLAIATESQSSISPKIATIFPLKMVCAHYLKLIDYFEVIFTKLAKIEWQLSRQSDWAEYIGPGVEEQWSSLQLSSRRLAELNDDVESILRDLGIPIYDISTESRMKTEWASCDGDLRYIYRRLQKMKKEVDQMVTSAMGLSNIVGSRQALSEARRSVKEAKSTKTLTIVGLVFIPLAYTCALFSMSDNFRPGAPLFWFVAFRL